MEELGTPTKLMDERMGHEDGSVQARYSHVTDVMRTQLMDGLTGLWDAALAARRAIAPRSPVAALDRLLCARWRGAVTVSVRDRLPGFSQGGPQERIKAGRPG
jgi:hypothetical protein